MTALSGCQIALSCSTVRQSHQSFSGFTTTDKPSNAISKLDVLDAVRFARLPLFVLDRPRGVADVDLAGGELLEAAAGAREADHRPHIRMLVAKLLRHRFGDRIDGARTVDANRAGRRGAGCRDGVDRRRIRTATEQPPIASAPPSNRASIQSESHHVQPRDVVKCREHRVQRPST